MGGNEEGCISDNIDVLGFGSSGLARLLYLIPLIVANTYNIIVSESLCYAPGVCLVIMPYIHGT